jgi:hypothetical protein
MIAFLDSIRLYLPQRRKARKERELSLGLKLSAFAPSRENVLFELDQLVFATGL